MSPNYRKLLLLIGAVALLTTSLVVGAPRIAEALPSQTCDCIYYNNVSHTTEVGERIIYCNGQVYRWGTLSSYSDCFCDPCGL